jgi:hypothetical protein
MTEFKKILKELSDSLSNVKYNYGDLSDIGNEIGVIIGKHITNKELGYDLESFIDGVKHGVSLSDGTHGEF